VEKVELSYNSEESTLHNYFNIENVIKYYMVCMAFAMADSVQKNLTVRCPNYNINRNNTWFIGFYDMDTAFGLSNSGGQINFTAFSDFVDSEGNIIQDYVEPGTEGWFDSPSSYLFLFAKYAGLLDNTFAGTDGKNYPF